MQVLEFPPEIIEYRLTDYNWLFPLQFVNFTKIMSENTDMEKKETAFALAALMEIPFQYKACQSLQFVE